MQTFFCSHDSTSGCNRRFVKGSPRRTLRGSLSDAAVHTPTEVTDQALELLREQKCDCLIAFGGGSSIGLGKALALRTRCPQIAVPTTYAGSEVTPILGETNNRVKTTRRSAELLPQVVIYDVMQTLTLGCRLD